MSGEGLQHEDGQSLLLASTVPSIKAYDPAFAYEMAAIVEHGIQEMYGPDGEDVLYYITLYNENYVMPPLPEGAAGENARQGAIDGIYRFAEPVVVEPPAGGSESDVRRATILFSGTAWTAAMQARTILAEEWNVSAEAWSVTNYKALREDALEIERWNRLHPSAAPRVPLVSRSLASSSGPIVAVTDFMKSVPDQIARFVRQPFTPLGTDGFGRSDTREALRRHFEVDAAHVVVAVLSSLASMGQIKQEEVDRAIALYGIDTESPDPRVA